MRQIDVILRQRSLYLVVRDSVVTAAETAAVWPTAHAGNEVISLVCCMPPTAADLRRDDLFSISNQFT